MKWAVWTDKITSTTRLDEMSADDHCCLELELVVLFTDWKKYANLASRFLLHDTLTLLRNGLVGFVLSMVYFVSFCHGLLYGRVDLLR